LEHVWEDDKSKENLTYIQHFFAFYILAKDNKVMLGHFIHVEEVQNRRNFVGFEGSEGSNI
jgi:regulatory protein YycI of two-component signal transduction system YycFG